MSCDNRLASAATTLMVTRTSRQADVNGRLRATAREENSRALSHWTAILPQPALAERESAAHWFTRIGAERQGNSLSVMIDSSPSLHSRTATSRLPVSGDSSESADQEDLSFGGSRCRPPSRWILYLPLPQNPLRLVTKPALVMELNTQTNRQDVEGEYRNWSCPFPFRCTNNFETSLSFLRQIAIALDLLSRDPVLFNSALNAYFAADARYLGHALDIRGVSAIKHVAWTFNLIDWGRGADVPSKKVSWDRNAITATIETQRHLRPVFFPLFTAAVPVKTRLHFNLQREKDSKCLKPILYVTLWEDEWPLGKWLQTLPLLGSLVRRVFTPVASFVITLVSNLVFSIFAWLNSAQPRYVSQSIEGCITYANRASDLAPRALRSGFNNGAVAARGRGHQAARLLYSIAHKPLILVGSTARSMTR